MSLESAFHLAVIEMERSAVALQQYRLRLPLVDVDSVNFIENFAERQILFYSLPQGHAVFQDRVRAHRDNRCLHRPTPVVDCSIPGPWQKYATVWRVLYPVDIGQRDTLLRNNFLY